VGDAGDHRYLPDRLAGVDEDQSSWRVHPAQLDREPAGAEKIELIGLLSGLEQRCAAGQAERRGFAHGELPLEKTRQG
jgi:hypothetical protein